MTQQAVETQWYILQEFRNKLKINKTSIGDKVILSLFSHSRHEDKSEVKYVLHYLDKNKHKLITRSNPLHAQNFIKA